jgi:hypothetical protein
MREKLVLEGEDAKREGRSEREIERAPASNALQERSRLKTGLNLRPPNFTVVTASLFCGHNDHVVSP